jgi:hypothetical protein
MVNYLLGKIYKIVDNTNNNNYIGSTCEPILARRLAGHVGSYKSYLNGKCGYITSFKVLENGNFNIVLLEEYPCDTKDQLLARERHYIDTTDCVNKCRAGIFNELGKIKYMQINSHNHHQKNKQKIHNRKNKKFNCECCGGRFTDANRHQHLNTPKHQNYLNNPLNNHDHNMKQIDNFLDDINNYINNLK